MFFTPNYVKEFIFPSRLGYRIATRQHIGLLQGNILSAILVRLAYRSIIVLIKCVDLSIKHVDLTETCSIHRVDVLPELL